MRTLSHSLLPSGSSQNKSDEATPLPESLSCSNEPKPKQKTWQEILQTKFWYDTKTGNLYSRSSGKESLSISKKAGYKQVRLYGKTCLTHRVVWEMHYGSIPAGGEIDHINHDRLDNRLENLRLSDHKDNGKNRKKHCANKSGLSGVSKYLRKSGKIMFEVEIRTLGKKCYLGTTADFFEACCLRKSAENKHGFHPNHGKTLT